MSDKPQETVTLTIDGKEVTVPKGTLVVHAAKQVGIEIPIFCSHPKLDPIGACRMCLVRVEKIPKLITACTLPAADGMVVTTDSEEVAGARAGVLEFMLSNHTLDCPFCDKGGECDLQDNTWKFGVPVGRFEEHKILRSRKKLPPIIEKVMSRCVQCARCIRYCDEIMGVGALRFINRGVRTEVATFGDGPMDCELCGNCIEVCPVGALTSEFYDMKARPIDRKSVDSLCQYCGDGCTMSIETKGRFSGEAHVIRTRGFIGKGINDDFLCVRGRFGYGMVNSSERLTQPLIRRDGALVPASWDEALDLIAARLTELRERHGANAIGGIGSEKVTTEEAYLFSKLMRVVVGTNNVDYRTDSKQLFRASSLARLLALAPPEGAMQRIERAGLIVLLGSDITSENPWTEKMIIKAVTKNRGRQLLAYPRKVRQTQYTSQWLRHAPGTDAALARGLADLARGEAKADAVATATGVTPEEVTVFLKQMQEATDLVFIVGPGITAGAAPDAAMAAVAELARALGANSKKPVHVVVQALHSNTRGAQQMGLLPDTYPGFAGMQPDSLRPAWGAGLPTEPGLNTVEMLAAAAQGTLKALYLVGANPLVSFPDGAFAQGALEKLELLVVQDLFLTPTAQQADVVLPAASFAEKDGTFINIEGRVQRVRRALEPLGEARADWEIFSDLARRLKHEWFYLTPQEVAREIAGTLPGFSGLNYRVLDLPLSRLLVEAGNGTPEGGKDKTKGGKAKAEAGSERGEAGAPPDFPFVLMTGQMLFHSGTLSTWAPEMRQINARAYVEITPEDAERLGVRHGDTVRLVSPRGEIVLPAHIQPGGTAGILFVPIHFAEPRVNRLLDRNAAVDRVRVEKA